MSHIPKLLVTGLGNVSYPGARNSVGHLLIDELASRTGISLSHGKRGFAGEGIVTLGQTPIDLTLYKCKFGQLKRVGRPLTAECRERGIRPDMLVVMSDSIYDNPCQLRHCFGGSAYGHDGVKSVIRALGTSDFYRLRLGVGRGVHPSMVLYKFLLYEHISGQLPPEERQFWNGDGGGLVCNAIEKIARAVIYKIEEGVIEEKYARDAIEIEMMAQEEDILPQEVKD
ncbi:peptidyl-tRNA hydrolase [Mycena maculata]|uniref:Peptidyl-tRNA hydrolase n=1 Tax=Mycena maculata TaxID=230809 RepID=A0AAD7IB01_9AGAR|nr:peptidyl-tRNA hydrolase [Mycena maculata]